MLQVAAIGVISVLLALQFKSFRQEYGIYIALAAGIFIFLGILNQLETILTSVRERLSDVLPAGPYLTILYKLIGIAYLSEFASGICKDAGYSFLAEQIELAGKVTIILISIPVLIAVLEVIGKALG